MFSVARALRFSQLCVKHASKNLPKRFYNKVVVLGAAGGVGQPLSLLLKYSTLIQELALYDIAHVKGLAADLSHINTKALLTSYQGPEQLEECLHEADIVIMAAGAGRKPGMHRADLFGQNAGIVAGLCDAVAKYSPQAMLCVLTNPINSTVPLAAEILKKHSVYDRKRLFGVINIDVMRANTFVAAAKGLHVLSVNVPVVGGHSGVTIVPLLSQTVPRVSFKPEDREEITKRIQSAGRQVVETKKGLGTAWLSMAAAVDDFINSLIQALDGKQGVIECAYVDSDVTEAPFFASPLLLGQHGLDENLGLGSLNEFEVKILRSAMPELIKDIELGVSYAKSLH